MEIVGELSAVEGRYEFRSNALNMVVTGEFPEWVLAAAAEMAGSVAQRDLDAKLSELEALVEFGEAHEIEVDAVKFDMKQRFEILPQCTVTMGRTDYRWVAPEARAKLKAEFDGHLVKRLHDMAMTRNDSFLVNENGVDTTGN